MDKNMTKLTRRVESKTEQNRYRNSDHPREHFIKKIYDNLIMII